MSMQIAPGCLVVTVKTRTELDAALDEAVDFLKPAAMAQHAGISVTRLAAGSYEARLNTDVPPGVTIESWESGAAMNGLQRGVSGAPGSRFV